MNNVGIFPVERMCKVMQVSSSSYYYWKNNPISKRTIENNLLSNEIVKIDQRSKGTYGVPRITKELNMNGYCVSRKRVSKLMKELNWT